MIQILTEPLPPTLPSTQHKDMRFTLIAAVVLVQVYQAVSLLVPVTATYELKMYVHILVHSL